MRPILASAILASGLLFVGGCQSELLLGANDPDQSQGASSGVSNSTASSVSTASTSTTSSTNATASTTSSGTAGSCNTLTVDDPINPLGLLHYATLPGLAQLPNGDALLTWVEEKKELKATALPAFSVWPPVPPQLVETLIVSDVTSYQLSPGPLGPVAVASSSDNIDTRLFSSLWPSPVVESVADTPIPISGGGKWLDLAAIQGRYLYASANAGGRFEFGSYQVGALPVPSPPLVCTSSTTLAQVAPTTNGFLSAVGLPNEGVGCTAEVATKPTSVQMFRYTDPGVLFAQLTVEPGSTLPQPEPLEHLFLSATSFGAWVVLQTDGSLHRQQPPASAIRVNTQGQVFGTSVSVTQEGHPFTPMTIASMGDALAVASFDFIDPSATKIIIQRVEADGSLGASTTIETGGLWATGGLRLLGSASGDALLVAWEAMPEPKPRIGWARVRCNSN